MADADNHPMVAQVDLFRDALRQAIDETIVDKRSPCAREARDGLRRISETLDGVPDVTLFNLSVLDVATAGMVMTAMKVQLLAVGAGPTLDFTDATAFLAEFEPMIEKARKRMLQ